MDARGTAQHQLDEMQRLRAVVDARLRSPWWVHVLLAAVLAAQFTLVVMDTTWSGLASFGVVLAVLLFSLWISGRRGLRPDAPLFGRQRRNARAALLAVVFCTLAVGLLVTGRRLVDGDHPVRLTVVALALSLVIAVISWASERRHSPRAVLRRKAPAPDAVLEDPERFQLCGVLAVAEAEVGVLAELVGLSEPVVRHHVDVLGGQDYVTTKQRRGPDGPDQAWVSLYYKGRGALAGQVAELQRLATVSAADTELTAD